jgi:hypothetical protein
MFTGTRLLGNHEGSYYGRTCRFILVILST